jgi:hypothetical protein
MRILALLGGLLLCLSTAGTGFAQKPGSDTITADQTDVGKLQARIQNMTRLWVSSPNWRGSAARISNAMRSVTIRPAASPSPGAAHPTRNATCTVLSARRSAAAIEAQYSSGNCATTKRQQMRLNAVIVCANLLTDMAWSAAADWRNDINNIPALKTSDQLIKKTRAGVRRDPGSCRTETLPQ